MPRRERQALRFLRGLNIACVLVSLASLVMAWRFTLRELARNFLAVQGQGEVAAYSRAWAVSGVCSVLVSLCAVLVVLQVRNLIREWNLPPELRAEWDESFAPALVPADVAPDEL